MVAWPFCLWLWDKVVCHSMAAMAEEIHAIQESKKERKTPVSTPPSRSHPWWCNSVSLGPTFWRFYWPQPYKGLSSSYDVGLSGTLQIQIITHTHRCAKPVWKETLRSQVSCPYATCVHQNILRGHEMSQSGKVLSVLVWQPEFESSEST